MKEDISLGALVAIYGDKPVELARLITDCQSHISNKIGAAFHPYDLQQVHGTITGIGQANHPHCLMLVFLNITANKWRWILMDLLTPSQEWGSPSPSTDWWVSKAGISFYELRYATL